MWGVHTGHLPSDVLERLNQTAISEGLWINPELAGILKKLNHEDFGLGGLTLRIGPSSVRTKTLAEFKAAYDGFIRRSFPPLRSQRQEKTFKSLKRNLKVTPSQKEGEKIMV
jgi:hypothetical protein